MPFDSKSLSALEALKGKFEAAQKASVAENAEQELNDHYDGLMDERWRRHGDGDFGGHDLVQRGELRESFRNHLHPKAVRRFEGDVVTVGSRVGHASKLLRPRGPVRQFIDPGDDLGQSVIARKIVEVFE